MTQTEIARQYRKEYDKKYSKEFPDGFPTLKLARIIVKENPLLFNGVEGARSILRKIEGKSGKKDKRTVHAEFYKETAKPYNPYKLPESFAEARLPFKLPLACNNILLISDLHFPYQDNNSITIALDYGVKQKINTVFINGDLIDFALISKYERDWSKRRPKEEFDATKDFLRILRKTFPTAEIFWLKGNHDIRWDKFLMQKAEEIWDDPYFSLEERLKLNEERIHLLDDKVLVKAGKLSITHGHLIFKGIFSPVSPARGAFLKAKQSVIVGHLHRASHHPEIDLDGNTISCWSTACLCELRPSYNPLVSNSQHGFAHITVENNGNYTVKNYQIIKGQIH